jgi:DNA-binding beta-propeller fold protein YncE
MKLFRCFVVLVATCCLSTSPLASDAQTGQEHATAPLLVVVNQGDKNLSLIDPVAGQQVATISEDQVNVWGHEVAVSPHGHVAFVPIYGSSGVGLPGIDGREMLAIDIPSRQIIGKVDFGRGVRPHCVVYDPKSDLLYVTTELTNSVTIVDPRTLKIIGSIPTSQPQSHMFAISHDGTRGYTANVSPGSVSVLDIHARKTITTISVSAITQRISISNDDRLVFTADQTQPRLAVIDTASNTIKTWIPLHSLGYGSASTPDGRWLLVATKGGEVAVVDLGSLTVTRTISVAGSPQEIIVSPDGKRAYVSCTRLKQNGQVAVLDLSQWNVQSLIEAGVGADGLAWAPGN